MIQNLLRLARSTEADKNLQSLIILYIADILNALRMYVPSSRTMSIEKNFEILQFSLTEP